MAAQRHANRQIAVGLWWNGCDCVKSSLHTVRQDYPGVQSVSRDGWILLRTPHFGQEVVLIPQAEGKNIRWTAHYNDIDKAINGKALCF